MQREHVSNTVLVQAEYGVENRRAVRVGRRSRNVQPHLLEIGGVVQHGIPNQQFESTATGHKELWLLYVK